MTFSFHTHGDINLFVFRDTRVQEGLVLDEIIRGFSEGKHRGSLIIKVERGYIWYFHFRLFMDWG